ncbi:MarR family transcriptional regulator [Pelotomaculum terephthalicicum JT]|uniref:MarR family winged helix-turn-helix transcriptional regulator n=2 Tax=Pelotomaculum TaxID=191373 RepID=UPI0009D40D0B|nr:MarR family transcriptional regulator [Pelotomaculum terephthalicicum]MCG9968309.1 MarR family transcriptional regulator [Pelotomaculum terephthalicicum JT]OPY63244.1 MAG: putative HTH-type transcriptional regulator YusO [Pelotomaculum sp. PtaU1.Bin065]
MNSEKLILYLERLDEVFQHIARRLHAELAQNMISGITMSQFVVLKKLRDKGRVTVSEVAEDLNVSLSAITALADRLHKAGLVDRSRDEQDRRLVWLTLTEEGENTVANCRKSRAKVVEKYVGQLPEEDLERLIQIYEKILAIMRAEGK